jgi:hypothetical protein
MIDIWNLNLVLAAGHSKINALANYNFNIEALDDTRISGSPIEERNDREMILLVYSKS